MSTPGVPQRIDVAAPPAVSRVVRALCEPWMRYKRAIHRPKQARAVFERVLDRHFVVWPGVLNPVTFRAGRYLAEFIAKTPRLDLKEGAGATALDLGTGCGILAVFAASRGYAVTATDIEGGAVSCARANAILNRVEDRTRVLHGDLFAPVEGQTFDVVMFNLPFFRGSARTPLERAWMSPDIIERCAAGLPAVLRPNGSAYFVLSSHGDAKGLLAALSGTGLAVERLTWRHFGVETLAIYNARYVSR
jgi:methylase of polypeptide subunit release factors